MKLRALNCKRAKAIQDKIKTKVTVDTTKTNSLTFNPSDIRQIQQID